MIFELRRPRITASVYNLRKSIVQKTIHASVSSHPSYHAVLDDNTLPVRELDHLVVRVSVSLCLLLLPSRVAILPIRMWLPQEGNKGE
jgi:hypothetical protein